MSIELTTLPNGLRIITDSVESVDSVAVGIWADVGTRHEDMEHNGVAHMVEHMMFKGTPSRNALQIVEQIEDVGGHVNAYTSREVTAYHIHLLKEHLPLALDILADIIQNPSMPDDEIERERSVILQEIGMSIDTPDDLVFDNYQETAYPGQALGAPILGTADIIKNMQRDTLMGYVRRFYTPSRLVLSVAGNARHEDIVEIAEKLFSGARDHDSYKGIPADYKGGEVRTEKELEQSHIVLGFRGVSRSDKNYYAASSLATILGGGMSSRLFQEVREKRGLVYSVFSFHSAYHDDGQFAIYAGTGPDDLPELIPVLCDEIGKITQEEVRPEELERACSQMKAGLLMSRESMMNRANQQAKHLINFNEIIDINRKISAIEAVTKDDVCQVAQQIFSGVPTIASLGPVIKLESYENTRKRFVA